MFLDKDTSIYRNYKLLKLEEPLELRSGGSSREFKAIVLDYLASPFTNLKVGNVVNVCGTFKIEPRRVKGRSDGYEFIIHVHNITLVDDVFEDSRISEDDINEIINPYETMKHYNKVSTSLMNFSACEIRFSASSSEKVFE